MVDEGLVSSVAALIAALAAIPAAVFSFGTWRSYRHEVGRAKALTKRVEFCASTSLVQIGCAAEVFALTFDSAEPQSFKADLYRLAGGFAQEAVDAILGEINAVIDAVTDVFLMEKLTLARMSAQLLERKLCRKEEWQGTESRSNIASIIVQCEAVHHTLMPLQPKSAPEVQEIISWGHRQLGSFRDDAVAVEAASEVGVQIGGPDPLGGG